MFFQSKLNIHRDIVRKYTGISKIIFTKTDRCVVSFCAFFISQKLALPWKKEHLHFLACIMSETQLNHYSGKSLSKERQFFYLICAFFAAYIWKNCSCPEKSSFMVFYHLWSPKLVLRIRRNLRSRLLRKTMYIQADRYFRLLWALFASFGKIGIFMNNGAPSKFTVYDPLKSDKKIRKKLWIYWKKKHDSDETIKPTFFMGSKTNSNILAQTYILPSGISSDYQFTGPLFPTLT